MDNNRIQLVVSKGPNPGQTYPLLTTTITIGRDPMADIVFNDPEVSRQHVRLSRTSDGYQIQDLGSTNGTYINGAPLEADPLTLTDGDEIAFGSGVTVLYQVVATEPVVPEPVVAEPVVTEPVAPKAASPEATIVEDDVWATAVDDPFADDEPPAPPQPSAAEMPATEVLDALSAELQDDQPEPEIPPEPPVASPPPAPRMASPPAPDKQTPLVAPGDVDTKKKRRRTTTIVISIILLLLCCCLAFAISGYFWWGDLLLEWLGLI